MNVVCVLADVVATKLDIILLFSFSFFPSTYFSPRRGLPRIFEFLHAYLSNQKIEFSPKKIGGTPLSSPKSSFMGGQQACEPLRWLLSGGVRSLWES